MRALLAFGVSRACIIAIALIALALVPIATPCGASCHLSANPLLDAASRWDGGWYLGIARDGYGHSEGAQTDLAFFPLYPALMHAIAAIVGGSDDALLVAGVLVSNVALAVTSVLLARLATIDHGAAAGVAAVVLLLTFPTTVVLSAVYAESLFLACAVAAVFLARREHWRWAAVAAALAALARPFGVVIVVPLAIELWAHRRTRWHAALLAAPVVAFAAWLASLWRMTGDPLAFLSAQASYGRRASVPLAAFADLFDSATYGSPWFIIAFGGLVAVLVVLSWRVLRPSLAAYGTVMLVVSLSTGTLTSLLRYDLAVFPAFIALATVRSPWPRRVYVAVAGGTAAIFTAMFALWYWIG